MDIKHKDGCRKLTLILFALTVCFAISIVTQASLLAQENTRRPEVDGGPTVPPKKGYVVQLIRDGLYWVSDGVYNTLFLVTSSGVIAVDAPPTLGLNYLKAIAEVTGQPIKYLVYSHEHTDHIGAAYLFPKTVKIVAQKGTAEILAQRKDPHRPIPTVTFEDTYDLTLGDQILALNYPGINHERGNIFIYASKQKTLMLVDVVYPGYMPYKNLGIAEDVQGYIEVHKKALAYDFSTFVGGHVTRLGNRSDVELSLEFVRDLRKTATEALNSLSLPDFAKANAFLAKDKWGLHNEDAKAVVDSWYHELIPRRQDRIGDSQTYLRDNCWAMMESAIVTLGPAEGAQSR